MRLAADAYRADIHFGGIEFELCETIEDRGEGMRRGSRDSTRFEIERNLQLDVLDIDDAVPGPFGFDIVGLKRPSDTIGERSGDGFVMKVIGDRENIKRARLMHEGNLG
jgi:hypothetical protein